MSIKLHTPTIAVTALLLSACVTTGSKSSGPVQFKNQTEASLKQAYTASELIWYTVQKRGNCADGVATIEIVSSLTRKSPDFGKSADGHVLKGSVSERWLAAGCGKTFPFDVKLAPDGKGGTDIYTSPVTSEWP